MTTRPRLPQLHQSGATNGQVPTWSTPLGYWTPGNAVDSVAAAATPDANGTLLFVWGINANGQGYYNASGVTAGQEARLARDSTTGRYYLEAITP